MMGKRMAQDFYMIELIKNVEKKTTILIACSNGEFIRVTVERLEKKPEENQPIIRWDEDAECAVAGPR